MPEEGTAHTHSTGGGAATQEARALADMFRVLSDPTRVLMLQALIAGGGLCVRELAEIVGVSQSAVSHQLRLLRTSRLVSYERRGRKVFYSPDDEHVAVLMSVCTEHVRHS
jgi:DNA-binding transcriptional ArsR family regulator